MGKYFGTDGIRGVALEKLNAELSYRLGQAIAFVFKPKTVVIGMDTRLSSPLLAYSIANGLMARSVNVIFAGVVSTPMIAHYSKIHEMIGIMITASHNPFTDNGIKVFNKGYKTIDEDELKLEDFIDHGELLHHASFGQLIYSDDIEKSYLKVYDQILLDKSDKKVIIDTAHGATYKISPKILSTYMSQFIQVGGDPNGLNINLNCGSTHLESLIEMMEKGQYDLAFSFDGDGDRIMTIDHKGTIYDGDMMIYVIASYMKQKGLLNKETVVLTKMSNPGLLKALKDKGINYHLTDVGDKYVFQALDHYDYTIGGESSGHIILKHLLHTGDGVLVAMYLLSILEELNTTLEELTKDVMIYPLNLTNIKDIDKTILKRPIIISTLEKLKQTYGDDVLILVRPSGTENLIRVTVSAKDEHLMNSISDDIIKVIHEEGGRL